MKSYNNVLLTLLFVCASVFVLEESLYAAKSVILANNTFNPSSSINFNTNTGTNIGPNTQTLGNMFQRLFNNQVSFTSLFSGFLKMCSFGFFIATVLKFKQYKENPTQIPVSTPFALLLVTVLASTSFMIIDPVTETMFGDEINNTCTGLPGTGTCD